MMRRCGGAFYFLILFVAFSQLSCFLKAEENPKNVICKSIQINAIKDFELIQKCKIIVGHVRIVNLDISPKISIPVSDVEEITDYLVVHRINGLLTLQHIFPRLKLIRGQELLFDRYSLVVFENRDLENLGLISLLRVQNGAVRIEKNPMLCFATTINWVLILGNSTQQHLSLNHNKPSHHCPLCVATDKKENALENSLKMHCWNLDSPQSNPVFGNLQKCQAKCGLAGCEELGNCCSRRCLTGCSDNKCEICATYKQNSRCVDKCDFKSFQYNKRECISEKNCIKNGLIPHAGQCLETCPKHYKRKDVGGGATPICTITCNGTYTIHGHEDLAALEDCTIIQGSLIIELKVTKAKIVDELQHALFNINEVTGYLKIKNSPQIVSLQFLKNLHTIRGNELIDDKYSFYVVNNYHLEHLWNKGQDVSIFKGRVYFHLNPRLCLDKIAQLLPYLKDVTKITPVDASPNSNGERVICGGVVRSLNATVEDFNSTAVRIKVDLMSADDTTVLVGYAHYYKEAPVQNVTRYDGRHGCGHDNWLMDISPNHNVRHIIANLKPYTQYAYFVKTITMTDYHTQLDAYSDIKYFRTLPSKPGPPAKVYYHIEASDTIILHWWPPLSPNGNIAHYLINYKKIDDNSTSDATTNYLNRPIEKPAKDICQCSLKEPFYSGPPPDDEKFYNKEQQTYDEVLTNVIYIARPITERKDSNGSFEELSSSSMENTTIEERNETFSNEIDDPSADNNTLIIKQQQYLKIRQDQEREALASQDTGIKDFPIKKFPFCKQENASVQYQIENDCRAIEHFEGKRIAGHIHHYVLSGLEPENSYSISVRACQENGECGGEAFIAVKTISKELEDFFKGAHTFANDIEN